MSRLEEKLIELGYEKEENYRMYVKNYLETDIEIWHILTFGNDEISLSKIYWGRFDFTKQEHIDSLQQAFNEMQKDLEVLKSVESN